MVRKLFGKRALALACSLAVTTPAAAASVVDVNNYNPTPGSQGWGAQSYWAGVMYNNLTLFQTWTVGTAGQLAGIDIWGSLSGTDGRYHLAVFRGGSQTGPGTQLLGEVSKSYPAPRQPVNAYLVGFDLTGLDIFAEAGETLTFRLRVDPCASTTCSRSFTTWSVLRNGQNTSGYAGGAMFTSVNGQRPLANNRDANFRTHMIPVPEPGAWALMILGLGGAGAMLRRRRAAPSPAPGS